MRAADPGERPLVAEERVQPPVVAARSRGAGPHRARAPPADVRQLRLGLPGVSSQTPARFLGPPSVRMSSPPSSKRRRSAGIFDLFPPPDAGSGRRSLGGSAAAARRLPSGTGATCRGAARLRTGVRRARAAAGRTSSASRCERDRPAGSASATRAGRARAPTPRPRVARACHERYRCAGVSRGRAEPHSRSNEQPAEASA